ncbi:hypothetical protein ABIB80_004534 [Bradyrhizobium sp. i1.15.2]
MYIANPLDVNAPINWQEVLDWAQALGESLACWEDQAGGSDGETWCR